MAVQEQATGGESMPWRGGTWKTVKSFFTGRVADFPDPDPPPAEWTPPPEGTDRVGVCCSGGGVRSASYSLGALQALAQEGVLQEAEYLSSVSGGGYIAGGLTMVATSDDQDAVWGDNPLPFAPRSPEETYLRNRSSYLAPTGEIKLQMVTRLLLGALVNIAFLGSLVVLLARPLGYLAAQLRPSLEKGNEIDPGRDLWHTGWTGVLLWAAFFLALVGFGGVMFTVLRRLLLSHETPLRRTSKGALGIAALIFGVLLVLPWALETTRVALTSDLPVVDQPISEPLVDVEADTSDGAAADDDAAKKEQQEKGASALARLWGLLAALGLPAVVAGAAKGVLKSQGSRLAMFAAGFVVPLLVLVGFLAAANDAASAGPPPWRDQWLGQILWLTIPVVVLAGLYFGSDLTATSLHPFYKRRLSTAFALERVSTGEPSPNNVAARERDYDVNVALSSVCPSRPGGTWPKLVCCAAANVSDHDRTPPGRRSVTFTFEQDRVGGPEVGYIPTKYFEQVLGKSRAEDVTVPAAMAISGAALSPSMGRMTKPSLRFLLALLNARLGVWLPNPRLAEQRHLTQAMSQATTPAGREEELELNVFHRPKPRFTWLWREMRGKNSADARFLYVTDGGHWENLGLVELLRRGCTKIYCFDAAGDKANTFFTIGEAIALAQTELGVEFADDFSPDEMAGPEGSIYAANDHVYGTFTYPSGRPGQIVFAKAGVIEDAPWAVRAYKERDPVFPNHTLLTQMFQDETFEAYRELGRFTAFRAVETMANPPAPTPPPP